MFVAIEPLLRHCTKLTLSLQMKGDEMVVCVMPQGTAKDAAMLQPLALTAMAAELDAGFVDALAAYTGAHASLAEQVAATTAILEAAKTTQVSKATKTLAKGGSKPALPAPADRPPMQTTMMTTRVTTLRDRAPPRLRLRHRPQRKPRRNRLAPGPTSHRFSTKEQTWLSKLRSSRASSSTTA
ncbi:PRTRC system protein E [Caballeronia sp. GaOx3]|uniref:PRTRC system protein E n=1 Tax=Caballeronia sp. GaOx3 TaxID=2921740 RepID=UPI0028A98F20|nr:PRTRC system protein E [Caballeronia sp. GaOx3]